MTQQALREKIMYDISSIKARELNVMVQQAIKLVDLENPKNDEMGSYLKIKKKLQQLKGEV